VFNVELYFLPERAGIPSVEIAHIEQHPQLSVQRDKALELRDTVRLIGEFSANVNDAKPATVFLINLNWHLVFSSSLPSKARSGPKPLLSKFRGPFERRRAYASWRSASSGAVLAGWLPQ